MNNNRRKNIFGKILLAVMCTTVMLVIFTVNAFAKENFKAGATYSMGGGQSTGFVNGSLVPLTPVDGDTTSAAETWKVTLYVGKNNSVRLSDKPTSSTYTRKTIIYSARGINTMNQNSGCNIYMGNADKIAYTSGMVNFSPVKIAAKTENPGTVGDQKFIVRGDIPRATYGSGQDKKADRAIKYFLTEKRETVLKDFQNAFGISVNDNVPWCLVLEPILRTFIDSDENVYVLYTATEYALAQSFSRNSGGYYDFCNTHMLEPYTFYNLPNYYRLVDGWLGISDPLSTSYKWTDIPNTVFYTRGSQERRNAEAYIQNNWSSIYSAIKNYGGCAMYCSPYFDNSDYTPSASLDMEKFENETVTLKTYVNRTNPEKEGKVNVTLTYDAIGSTIDGSTKKSLTKTVYFDEGDGNPKELTWQIQVGSYDDADYPVSRNRRITLTVTPYDGNTVDLDANNNTVEGTIRLKRDFKVTEVTLNQTECFENSNVSVKFSVKNMNPYKAYSNVPVAVYFRYGEKTLLIGNVTVSLEKNGTKTGTCMINVGCVTENKDQTDSVAVVINKGSIRKYIESDESNNELSKNVKVKRDINLSISIVYDEKWGNPIGNAPSKVKNTGSTQAVTTCAVTNHSRFNLYETDLMKDKITVNFYVNNKLIGSKVVPVPRYGSNLVWFKWDVPDGASVTLRAEMSWSVKQESAPDPYTDNTATKILSVDSVKEFETPNPVKEEQWEHGSNRNYSNASGYMKFKPSIAKWSQWIYDSEGVFTRIDYAMTGDSTLVLTPDKDAKLSNGNTIIAGSGFEALFSYKVRTECSEAGYDVSPNDYTYAQNVVAMFPEFMYTNKGDCRTMYLVAEDGNLSQANFRFEPNADYSKEVKKRMHFSPYNMPDGEYKVGVVADSMWTPAGPIYVNAASSLVINGVLTDDHAVNASSR